MRVPGTGQGRETVRISPDPPGSPVENCRGESAPFLFSELLLGRQAMLMC